jgi:hypothetical protein
LLLLSFYLLIFRECLFALVEAKSTAIDLSAIDPRLDESFTEGDDSEFDQNEVELDIYFFRKKRLSCFAHNLMLAAKKVMCRVFLFCNCSNNIRFQAVQESVQVDDAKKKAESLIASVSQSPKAVELLKSKTGGIGLVKPVRTRWIYWYYVFDRLIRIKR